LPSRSSSSFSPPLTLRSPRLTFVSDGKPRRRLLIGSKRELVVVVAVHRGFLLRSEFHRRPAWTARRGALRGPPQASAGDADGGIRTPMALASRRFLRPVRQPSAPHPHEEPQARAAERAARRSCRRPRSRPVATRSLTRLPTRVELHDLGGTRGRLRQCRDPNEMEMHLASSQVVGRSRRPRPSEPRA
jgi:hypothetical protein